MAYTLSNKNIALANPSAVANRAYIDALYLENPSFKRKATEAEYQKFKAMTVKDASNIILGQAMSPYSAVNIPITSKTNKYLQPTQTAPVAPVAPSATTTPETPKYDPLKEVTKYGYTAQDFANDPNFVKYWSSKSPQELKVALSSRPDFDKTTGSKKTQIAEVADTATEELVKEAVRTGVISADDAPAALEIINKSNTKTGISKTDAEIEAEIADIKTAVSSDINPYYEEQQKRGLSDLGTNLRDIQNESLRYAQKEKLSYAQLLAKTQASLRARGLTFSGTSIKSIGDSSAQLNPTGIEGEIPQERRYNWEDATAGWQESARDIGMEAERKYGSATLADQGNLSGLTYANPYGTGGSDRGVKYKEGTTGALYIPHQATIPGTTTPAADYVKYGDIELAKLAAQTKEESDRIKNINTLKTS